MSSKKDWLKNVSRKKVIFLNCVWGAGILLLIISMTDLFSQSPFHKKYYLLYMLIFGSTWTMVKLNVNHSKTKSGLAKGKNNPEQITQASEN